MVRHVVFWKIKDDEHKQTNLEKMRENLLSLTSKINGIVSAEVGFNFSSSDYDIILDVIFVNPFALKQYQSHPENIKVKKFTDAILIDRVACDYMIEPADTIRKQGAPDIPVDSQSISSSQDMRAPIARVNKNSGMMQEPDMVDSSQGRYNDNFDNNYNESYNNNMPPKRETLARTVNNVDDSAFSLPYENNNNNNYQQGNDSFDLPFNKQQDNRNRQGQKQASNTNTNLMDPQNNRNHTHNTSGQLPFIDQNALDNAQMNDSWKCPKCGKVNGGYVNMCSCGRRKPVMQGGNMPPNKRMIQKTQNSVLINSGVLPNLSETQDMKAVRGELGNTGIIPLQQMQKRGEQMNFNKQGQGNEELRGNEAPWKCPQCGKLNAAFTNVCSCGRRKPPMKAPNGMRQRNSVMNGNRQNPFVNNGEENFNQEQNFRGGNRPPQGARSGLELPGPGTMGNGQNDSSTFRIEPKGTQDRDMSNAWTCPNCGKVNGDFVGLCGCGQRKTVGVFNPNNDFKQGQTQALGGQIPPRKNGMNMPPRGGNKQGMNQGQAPQSQGGGALHSLNDAINNFKAKSMQTINNAMNANDEMGFYDENTYEEPNQSQNRNIGGFRTNPQMQQMPNDMDSWKCPRCGKINGNFVGQCGCGQRKPARNTNRMEY